MLHIFVSFKISLVIMYLLVVTNLSLCEKTSTIIDWSGRIDVVNCEPLDIVFKRIDQERFELKINSSAEDPIGSMSLIGLFSLEGMLLSS